MRCPCQSGATYEGCCAKYIITARTAAPAFPPTAEALMRSRFSAFAVGDVSYLLQTWHASTRPASLLLDPGQQWYRLDILSTSGGGLFDTQGVVSFTAHYRSAADRKDRGSLNETSSFLRADKQWFYVEALALH